MKQTLLIALSGAALALSACAEPPVAAAPPTQTDPGENGGGKVDTPEGKDDPEIQCLDRQDDVLNSAQKHFTETAIRWACADVDGVNTVGRDDRGQEYCEYFSVVQAPPIDGSEEGERPAPIALGQNQPDGTVSDLKIELNDDQIFYLEDHPDEVMGQCVFTSWHQDIPDKLAVCEDETCPNADLMGLPLNADHFRMKVSFNSNLAASALVRDCIKAGIPSGDADDPEDPLHSDFFRGCMVTAQLYGTQWRRSDPQVCAAAIRMVECGCGLPDGADVPTSLIPPREDQVDAEGNPALTLRGFALGTWADPKGLPLGCRFVETGEQGQNIVSCDLTAADLLVSTDDPKGKCRDKYGDNVVVHVPIPENAITCTPPAEGLYNMCSATPWVVEN